MKGWPFRSSTVNNTLALPKVLAHLRYLKVRADRVIRAPAPAN